MGAKLADIKPDEVLTLADILQRLIDKIKETVPEPLLYDLGCGYSKAKGLVGVDMHADADIRHDLFSGEWTFAADGSVDLFFSSHFVEHVPDWNQFFGNAYHKLKPGGYMMNVTPYGNSVRAWQDSDHKRPIFLENYSYLDQSWRKRMNINHYGIPPEVDLRLVNFFPAWNSDFVNLSESARDWHAKHSWNVIDDLTVVLRKPDGTEEAPHHLDEPERYAPV